MADTFKYVQTQAMTLYGAGASIGDTSLRVVGFNDLNGTALAITDFGSKGFGTIEPGTTDQEEPITFTGVTNNGDGTSTLTGIKTQLGKAPYTETSGLAITHAGGTTFALSNTAGFYDALSGKGNDETVTGIWTFTAPNYPQMDSAAVAPTLDVQLVTKKYADDLIASGAPKATDSVYGISKLSVAAASAAAPIVVGTNDNRVSPVSLAAVTADKVAALAGTGTPNGTTGKYVTNDDTSATSSANKVVRYGAGGMIKSATTAASVAGDVVALDAGNKLPAVDGSQLTGLSQNKILFKDVATHTLQGQTDTSLTSTTIAAGTLGTNYGLKVKIMFIGSGNQAGQIIYLKLGATALLNGIAVNANGNQVIEVELYNNGSASAQVGNYFSIRTDTQGYDVNHFSSSENTANALTLDLRVTNGNANNRIDLYMFSVELLRG